MKKRPGICKVCGEKTSVILNGYLAGICELCAIKEEE